MPRKEALPHRRKVVPDHYRPPFLDRPRRLAEPNCSPIEFEKFPELLTELKLRIIRKCKPVPYTRLRQTCRCLDKFCEKNRQKLGIYIAEDNCHLYLLNALNYPPFTGYEDPIDDYSYDRVYLALNYMQDGQGYPSFLVKMVKSNVKLIRKSLSGFAFNSVALIDCFEDSYGFEEAMPHFMKVVADINIMDLTIRNMSIDATAQIMNSKNIKNLEVESNSQEGLEKILELDGMKNVESIYFHHYEYKCEDHLTEDFFIKAAEGKKSLDFLIFPSDSVAWNSMNTIFKKYKRESKYPETFSIVYQKYDMPYYEKNMFEEWSRLMPESSVYMGSFKSPAKVGTFEPMINQKARDIWINKDGEDKWQLFIVMRHAEIINVVVKFTLETFNAKKEFDSKLVDILRNIFENNKLNYTVYCEKFDKLVALDDVKTEFCRAFNFLQKFIKGTVRD